MGGAIYRIVKNLKRPYNTVQNEVKRGSVLLYYGKQKCYKADEGEPCVLTLVEHITRRPQVQVLPAQQISATKKDIAPKTRDFLGFSSFFAVFQALAKQVLLFSNFKK